MNTLIKFEEGKTYATPSIVDSSFMITVTVVKRTAKRVTFSVKGESETVTKGIGIYEGKEFFYPNGQHSMCPIIRADDGIEPVVSEEIPLESKVLFESGETLADLFREGAGLFSKEQMDAIKMGFAEVLIDEAFTPVKPMAKVYNMADYRR